jgi:hypothetical protein
MNLVKTRNSETLCVEKQFKCEDVIDRVAAHKVEILRQLRSRIDHSGEADDIKSRRMYRGCRVLRSDFRDTIRKLG